MTKGGHTGYCFRAHAVTTSIFHRFYGIKQKEKGRIGQHQGFGATKAVFYDVGNEYSRCKKREKCLTLGTEPGAFNVRDPSRRCDRRCKQPMHLPATPTFGRTNAEVAVDSHRKFVRTRQVTDMLVTQRDRRERIEGRAVGPVSYGSDENMLLSINVEHGGEGVPGIRHNTASDGFDCRRHDGDVRLGNNKLVLGVGIGNKARYHMRCQLDSRR